MGRARKMVPWAVLVVSFSLNVHLLYRQRREHDRAAERVPAAERSASPAQRPFSSSQLWQGQRDASPLEVRISEAERELAALEKGRMPTERVERVFERGKPDLAAKKRLEPELRRLLDSPDGGTVEWVVECRDQICKLQMFYATNDPRSSNEKMSALQSDLRMRSWVAAQTFTGAGATDDALSGKRLVEEDDYMRLRPEAEAAKMEASLTAQRDFVKGVHDSPIIRDCTGDYSQRGTVRVQFTSVPDGAVNVALSGPLADGPAATCLRARFTAAAANIPKGLDVTLEFDSPPITP